MKPGFVKAANAADWPGCAIAGLDSLAQIAHNCAPDRQMDRQINNAIGAGDIG